MHARYCFSGIILALQASSLNFESIKITTIKPIISTYGYITSWVAECFFAPDTTKISEELISLQHQSPDRLAKIEPSWPIRDKIVIIQLESFDFNILNYKINNKEITPFLNKILIKSCVFKLRSYHNVSSADMDYALLSDGIPSSEIVSYMVRDIPYNNSLPHFLQKHGYHTVAWHGNVGNYFNRSYNFKRMGFDEVWFREDLNHLKLKHSGFGIRNAEIFRLSSKKINTANSPEFHFIITLDSHGPFDFISNEEKMIFPNSQQWQQNYFNSMYVLDRSLQEYIESLPVGTLVVLYGDHSSGVKYGDFYPSCNGSVENVPCIVHVCKANIS